LLFLEKEATVSDSLDSFKKILGRIALVISLIAIMTAMVAVFTIAVRIPTPTGGYISLCDVAVTFSGYAFGPFVGFVAGGLGTAFSDLVGGYPQWAAISFFVHGIEGLLVGLLVKSVKDSLFKKILAAIVATITVSLGYFLLTGLFLTTFSEALTEILPNAIQGGVGSVLGLVLYSAVASAYRKLDMLRIGF